MFWPLRAFIVRSRAFAARCFECICRPFLILRSILFVCWFVFSVLRSYFRLTNRRKGTGGQTTRHIPPPGREIQIRTDPLCVPEPATEGSLQMKTNISQFPYHRREMSTLSVGLLYRLPLPIADPDPNAHLTSTCVFPDSRRWILSESSSGAAIAPAVQRSGSFYPPAPLSTRSLLLLSLNTHKNSLTDLRRKKGLSEEYIQSDKRTASPTHRHLLAFFPDTRIRARR